MNAVPTMQKQHTERLAVPTPRLQSPRRRRESPARAAEAPLEGWHEAGGVGGLMDLQRTVGNQAVAGLVASSPHVVARQTAAPVAPPVNDQHAFEQLTPMGLIVLYISTDHQYVDGKFEVPGANAAFSKDWIIDKRGSMLELIAEKMEAQHEQAGVYGQMVSSKPGDPERIGKVKDLLTHEYSQDLGFRLSEDEGTKLRENTKEEILDSMEQFGYACQNQKAEVRADLAEDAELFSFILEIAFSFVPVAGKALGKLAGKGLKPETYKMIEKGLEKAEAAGAKEGVEAALKGAQRAIKGAHSSHKSEGEEFIDTLHSEARKAGNEVRGHVDRMTYGQMAQTFAEFAAKSETYEEEIASKLEMFKKSAGHIGETRAWEYGQYRATMGGNTQAAKIETPRGARIALITYELDSLGRPRNDQPVFLDWVPREMEEMTLAKSKDKYGEPMALAYGAFKIPPEYQWRWVMGYTGASQ